MNSSFTRALSALTRSNNTVQKETAMKATRISLAAIMAVIPATTVLGCGSQETAEETLQKAEVEVILEADVCNETEPPKFCQTGVTLKMYTVDSTGAKVNSEKADAELKFAFADGEAMDTKVLPRPGNYTMAFEGFDGTGYKPVYAGSFDFDEERNFPQGLTTLKFIVEAKASSGPTPDGGIEAGFANICANLDHSLNNCRYWADKVSYTPVEPDGDAGTGTDGGTCDAFLAGIPATSNPSAVELEAECEDDEGNTWTGSAGVLVTKDETAEADVEMHKNTSPDAGPTEADLCAKANDKYGAALTAQDFVLTIDGNPVVVDDDLGGDCPGGKLVIDIAFKSSYEIKGVYGTQSKAINTALTPGGLTTITLNLEENGGNLPTTGTACTKHYDSTGTEVDGCVDDWSAIDPDPSPVSSDPGVCDGTGQSYYEDLFPHNGTIWSTCQDAAGKAPISIEAGKMTTQEIWVYGAVADDDICTVDHAFIVDAFTSTSSLQNQIGFGVSGACNVASVTSVSSWDAIAVTGLSGDNCVDISDDNCRLTAAGTASDPLINGLYPHLLWTGTFDDMDPEELLIYVMDIEDSTTTQSMTRSFWVFNGDAQIVTTMSHEVLVDFTQWMAFFAPEVRRIPGSFWKTHDVRSLVRTSSRSDYRAAKRAAFRTFVSTPQTYGLRAAEVPRMATRLQLIED